MNVLLWSSFHALIVIRSMRIIARSNKNSHLIHEITSPVDVIIYEPVEKKPRIKEVQEVICELEVNE